MSRTPNPRRLAVVTVVAAALLAAGGALAYRPALVLETVPDLVPLLEALEPSGLLLAFVGVLLLVLLALGFANRRHAAPSRPLVADDDGSTAGRGSDGGLRSLSTGAAGRPVVGADVRERIDVATDYDGSARDDRQRAREAVVGRLRPVATAAYARRTGSDRDAARQAIEAGTWTDDPRAAAFLAAEDGPSTPLSLWLYDLLLGSDPFSRSLERTIDEIDAVQTQVGGRL